ncbi:MAG: sensor domain-containing diguanylate cyclase [Rhodospirillales bacterium]|nr:sensor domain-containing diguanylate cyclase [Rhodospirillales bacterium]
MTPPISLEEQRIAALHRYDVLDTPQEENFERIARLAQAVVQAPIVAVNLIDRDRQWSKAAIGFPGGSLPRDISFCTHAIERDIPLIVADATEDRRFAHNPMVQGEPGIRFYLGVPLRTPDGFHIGTLCAADAMPREVSAEQVAMLQDLARLVVDALELRRMAITDSLTGLQTRRGFFQEARRALEQTRRYGHPLSCVMLDIDHFKAINDRYGHPAGDRLLCAVAGQCRTVIRAADIAGRLGGEEFALLLTETDGEGAAALAERLRRRISRTVVETEAGSLRVTASFGIAALAPEGRGDAAIAALLEAADRALYRAKAGGRDRVEISGE